MEETKEKWQRKKKINERVRKEKELYVIKNTLHNNKYNINRISKHSTTHEQNVNTDP
jgi:hypothetical protein